MIPRAMSRDEVRAIDRRAIDEFHMPSIVLMENAGRGAAELLLSLGVNGPVAICCGKGNNAGDGFVIARHLEIAGHDVRILLLADPDELGGDAATNFRIIERAGLRFERLPDDPDDMAARLDERLARADWIVDALLGTGTTGEIRPRFARIIERIGAAPAKVLAIDLPSGLDCDTGRPLGRCVHADHTATFVARKQGFDRPEAAEFIGEVHVIGIGVPIAIFHN